MNYCDKCKFLNKDEDYCDWTFDGKFFVCVGGHIMTDEEKLQILNDTYEFAMKEKSNFINGK